MMKMIKEMIMKGLGMLTTKKGMLAAILLVAGVVGHTMNPEIASSLAEHLSALLDMALDAMSGKEAAPEVAA